MKKQVLQLAILATLSLNSCKESQKQQSTKSTSKAVSSTTVDKIVTDMSIDKDGNKIDMTFNNTNDTATLNFKGETIDLVGQKPASGIWYKNDHYELRGKGEDIELKKDGKLVYKSK